MYKKEIRLSQETVRMFVSAACRCDFKVNLCHGSVTVDAKSIMGVFSMDLSRVLTVMYYGEDENFESLLNQLSVE